MKGKIKRREIEYMYIIIAKIQNVNPYCYNKVLHQSIQVDLDHQI
jgi:hypothetical protein